MLPNAPAKKEAGVPAALAAIRSEDPTVTDFEREFPSQITKTWIKGSSMELASCATVPRRFNRLRVLRMSLTSNEPENGTASLSHDHLLSRGLKGTG
jgi:hypothetical protein